ncbi:MAG TPA: MFS transporter [Chitinophagaceae bacterium]|jgi:predicted MFS family arabinose efflux permease
MKKTNQPAIIPFTAYQKLVILILALTQFTVILDFMIMNPLGDLIKKAFVLSPSQFAKAVSAYAFSAGIAGLLTAGFADRFDRKKLLLFFYTGFIAGTVFCGLAQSYWELMGARIVTGLFGGVVGSIGFAIIADLFSMELRGRVMGFIMMGFGASQVLGIPIGIYIAYHSNWHMPFLVTAGLAAGITVLIALKMQPVNKHLAAQHDRTALQHIWHTVKKRNYLIGFAATSLLQIGGYMMMPFGTIFALNNLRISSNDLTGLFIISGLCSVIIMPLIGRMSDRIDKFKIFVVASLWMMIIVVPYTHLGVTPFWEVMIFNILIMIGVLNRMVPANAITSAVPDVADRGSYMSVSAALQQVAGGIGSLIAGWIVLQKTPDSPMEHYSTLGYTVVGISALCILLMYRVNVMIKKKPVPQKKAEVELAV